MDFLKATDEEIVDSCRSDSNNYGYLVKRYERFLINYLLKNFKFNRADAEDLAQEALTKAFINLHRFTRGKKWRPWLFQITINCAKSFKRKHFYHSIEEYRELATNDPGAQELLQVERIGRLLNQLSPLQQKLVRLHFLDGASIQEISRLQKIPATMVRAGIEKARKDLIVKYFIS